jgi:hypothetical protein
MSDEGPSGRGLVGDTRAIAGQIDFLNATIVLLFGTGLFLGAAGIVLDFAQQRGQADEIAGVRAEERLADDLLVGAPNETLLDPACTQVYFDSIDDGRLARYPLDETSGPAEDVVNGFDASLEGGVSPVDDPDRGRVYEFPGGDGDYLDAGGAVGRTLRGSATLSAWVNTTQSPSTTADPWEYPGLSGVEEAGTQDDIFWGYLNPSGQIGVARETTGGTWIPANSTTKVNDGDWHHVAFVREADTGELRTYVDGSLEATADSVPGTVGTDFASLGRVEDTGGSPEEFKGRLDDVRVYDRALSNDSVGLVYEDRYPACDYDFSGESRLELLRDSLAISGEQAVNVTVERGSVAAVDVDGNGQATRLAAGPDPPETGAVSAFHRRVAFEGGREYYTLHVRVWQ